MTHQYVAFLIQEGDSVDCVRKDNLSYEALIKRPKLDAAALI